MHTPSVRLTAVPALALALLAISSSTAGADRAGYSGEVRPVVNEDFWREVVEPHAEEVALVIGKINQALDLVTRRAAWRATCAGSPRRTPTS